TLENLLVLIGGNSRPIVGHRDHGRAVGVLAGNHDASGGTAVLERIVDHVGDGVEDQVAIAGDQHLAFALHGQPGAVLFGRGIVQLDDFAGDLDQVDGAEA